MTVPRDLSLEKIDAKYFLASRPVPELSVITESVKEFKDTMSLEGPARIDLKFDTVDSYEIVLSNDSNEQVIIGYEKLSNNYYIDRTKSGNIDFEKGFAARHTAPRISMAPAMDLTLIIDNASVELFADSGLTVMSEIFFPRTVYKKVQLKSSTVRDRKSTYQRMFGIWTK